MLHAAADLLPLLHAGVSLGWTRFTVHPSTVIGLALLAALYTWRARRRTVRDSRLGWTKPALFATGILTMFLALNGWLHDLSDAYLFSAHMVQHLLLAFAVAPLLIMGTPGWMLRPVLQWPGVAAAARWLTRPVRAFAIFNIVVAVWHLPVMYNLALLHHPVHIVQHLMFIAAAIVMWWPVLSPIAELPRIAYPAQMLYLFLMSIPMSIISVYIAYADSMLFPAYAAAPRLWGISPMQDQLIGGLIMWIPGGLYFFTVISIIFFRWQQRGADDTVAAAQVESWEPVPAGGEQQATGRILPA